MSRKGHSPDNARMEGFFGRLKMEFFDTRDWQGVSAGVRRGLDRWLTCYNEEAEGVSGLDEPDAVQAGDGGGAVGCIGNCPHVPVPLTQSAHSETMRVSVWLADRVFDARPAVWRTIMNKHSKYVQ